MANIEQLLSNAQNSTEFYKAPSAKQFSDYLKAIRMAYKKTGLDRHNESSMLCPVVEDADGRLELIIVPPFSITALSTQILVCDARGQRALTGEVSSKITETGESFDQASFQARPDAGSEMSDTLLSKRSWGQLSEFVIDHARSGMFVPMERISLPT